MNNIKDFGPVTNLSSYSIRLEQQRTTTNIDENELIDMDNHFVQDVLEALNDRFDTEAKELIEN